MRRTTKIIFVSIVLLAFLTIAYLVGFYFGIRQGAEQWVFLTAPVQGIERVNLLRMLRKGEFDKVIRLHETQLDYYILYQWDFLHDRNVYFTSKDMRILREEMPRLMTTIAKYRKRYPPSKPFVPEEEKASLQEIEYFKHVGAQDEEKMEAAISYYLERDKSQKK